MRVCLLFLFLFMICVCFGQKVTMYKTFGGVVFEMNDSTQLSMKQTMMLLYKNQPAYEEMKKAKTLSTVSAIMGFSGGAMLAIPLVTAIVGQEPEWGLAAGGGGLLAGAFFLHQAFKSKALDAIDLYNSQLPQKTSRIKPEFFFYGTGARIVIRF